LTATTPTIARPNIVRAASRFGQLRLPVVALTVIGVACALLGAERIWLALAQPLWFDEAWTAALAATPDWRSLLDEAYNDINAPLYYVLMRLWTGLAGPSDIALRIPGLLALAAAGAIPIFSRIPGLKLEARVAWGVMIFAWWGVGIFLLGRCYGLLLAVSTLQCVLFARLLLAPSRRTAWAWCAVGAVAILLQYYALMAVAAQGLIYLAARRGAALRTWPALLAFAPALGWMTFHAPRLAAFAAIAPTWHPAVTPATALAFTAFVINPVSPFVLPAVAVVLLGFWLLTKAEPALPREDDKAAVAAPHLWLTALSGGLALGLILLSGVLRPTLTARYMIPATPGLLLAVVLCARLCARAHLAYLTLVTVYLGAALLPGDFRAAMSHRTPYGYEDASDTLMRHGVTHVVFVWDHEAARFERPSSLQRVGAVFFRRAGDGAAVTPLATGPAQDVNALALAAATGPRPGIIWIYNRNSATSARTYPPRIAQIDPRWDCERSGDATLGTLACYRAR
jgi:hypothetical protein